MKKNVRCLHGDGFGFKFKERKKSQDDAVLLVFKMILVALNPCHTSKTKIWQEEILLILAKTSGNRKPSKLLRNKNYA